MSVTNGKTQQISPLLMIPFPKTQNTAEKICSSEKIAKGIKRLLGLLSMEMLYASALVRPEERPIACK